MSERHTRLLEILNHNKPRTIVEFGTFNGVNALQMCAVALKHHEDVHYFGVDLFEHKTETDKEAEFDVKEIVKSEDVEKLLERVKEKYPKFTFDLFAGNSNEIQPGEYDELTSPDFVFIDGGHSLETIKHDYELVKDAKVVVFDDYYTPDEDGKLPDLKKFGCNSLVETLDASVISTSDACSGGGKIQLAVTPPNAAPYPAKLQVKTRNPIPDESIQSNIRYSTSVIRTWLPLCEPHDKTCVIVSGGPTYKDHIEEIRELSEKDDHYIFCVKTSHHDLIERDIIPFACVLLDPRPKIRRAFEGGPDKRVNYFVASSCHPAVIDMLTDYKIFLYNALLNAGEIDVIRNAKSWLPKDNPHCERLIGGGTTASGRAILLAKLLGFRKLILFGFDSSYKEPQDKAATTKHGQTKFWEIEKYGKKFWTSLEMLAQLQDFETLFQHIANDPIFSIEMVGEGAIPHIWNHMKGQMDDFEDFVNNAKLPTARE